MCCLDATCPSDTRGNVIFFQNSLVQLAAVCQDGPVLSICLGLGLVFIQQEELIIGMAERCCKRQRPGEAEISCGNYS